MAARETKVRVESFQEAGIMGLDSLVLKIAHRTYKNNVYGGTLIFERLGSRFEVGLKFTFDPESVPKLFQDDIKLIMDAGIMLMETENMCFSYLCRWNDDDLCKKKDFFEQVLNGNINLVRVTEGDYSGLNVPTYCKFCKSL